MLIVMEAVIHERVIHDMFFFLTCFCCHALLLWWVSSDISDSERECTNSPTPVRTLDAKLSTPRPDVGREVARSRRLRLQSRSRDLWPGRGAGRPRGGCLDRPVLPHPVRPADASVGAGFASAIVCALAIFMPEVAIVEHW